MTVHAQYPFPPEWPGWPTPRKLPEPSPQPSPLIAPVGTGIDSGAWQDRLRERLLAQRVIMVTGHLDDTAATLLAAQLLTLDADSADRAAPIRLHMQNVTADLGAALAVLDTLDTVGVPVHAFARGQLAGPALGVLAAAGRRVAYPSSGFLLSEPQVQFEGTAADLAVRQRQFETMLDALYVRLAEVTDREVDEIRSDARHGRFLTADEAVAYRLIQEIARAT